MDILLSKWYTDPPMCRVCRKEQYNVTSIYTGCKPVQYEIKLCGDRTCTVHCHCHM